MLAPIGSPAGPGEEPALRTWEGTGTKTLRLDRPVNGSRVTLRIICDSGTFVIRGASGKVVFGGDCDPHLAAGGAAAAALFGAEVRLEVESRVRWVAAEWTVAH